MSLKEKIIGLITPAIENKGFELIELKIAQYKTQSRVRIFVDSDNGVTIDDCVLLTKTIDPILEDNNVFRHGYIIEVSSPGLDRPLTTARDFRRRIGEKVKLQFVDASEPAVEGELIAADDNYVELLLESGTGKYELPNIKSGKIIF